MLSFAVKLYDRDGDEYDSGIFIFTDGNGILRFDTIHSLESFIDRLTSMLPEIQETLDNR